MAASRSSADVLVVGAGVVGLSIALALRTRGAQVVVLERAGVAEGQSGIQPGGIRLQWGTMLNCRLAVESRAWWTTAGERLDGPAALAFDSCGYLFVAHSEAVLERLAAAVRLQMPWACRRASFRPRRRGGWCPASGPSLSSERRTARRTGT